MKLTTLYRIGNLIDFSASEHTMRRTDRPLSMQKITQPASKLLELLISRKWQTVSHKEIYDVCWEKETYPNTLYQTVFQLRRNISALTDNSIDLIKTDTRSGFFINPSVKIDVIMSNDDPVNNQLSNDSSLEAIIEIQKQLQLLNVMLHSISNKIRFINENNDKIINDESIEHLLK